MYLMIDNQCVNAIQYECIHSYNDKSSDCSFLIVDDGIVKQCTGADELIGKVVFITTNPNSIRLSEKLVTVDNFLFLPRHVINYVYHLCLAYWSYHELAWIKSSIIEFINYIMAKKYLITTVNDKPVVVNILGALKKCGKALMDFHAGASSSISDNFIVSKYGCLTTNHNKPLSNDSFISCMIDEMNLNDLLIYQTKDNNRLQLIKACNDLIVLSTNIFDYEQQEWSNIVRSYLSNICMDFIFQRRMLDDRNKVRS